MTILVYPRTEGTDAVYTNKDGQVPYWRNHTQAYEAAGNAGNNYQGYTAVEFRNLQHASAFTGIDPSLFVEAKNESAKPAKQLRQFASAVLV